MFTMSKAKVDMKNFFECSACSKEMEAVKLDLNHGFWGGGQARLDLISKNGRSTIMTESKNKSALYCEACNIVTMKVNLR